MLDSISFIRIIKTGFSNFTRNWLLSAAAGMVMTITLVIFATMALLFSVANYSIKSIGQRVDISVYMKKGLAEDRILDIKRAIEENSLVREVSYISAEKALADFRARHSGSAEIISALNEVDENPLLATLRVKARNLEDYPRVSESIASGAYAGFIEKLNYNDNREVIDRLARILSIIVSIGISLILVFSAIAILVLFNTLRLTIYNRREEVEIMRLVGATNWSIRGPFLAEAIMYSLSAVIIAALLLIPIYTRVLPKIVGFVASDLSMGALINYWLLLAGLLLIGIVLSVVSTLLAIRKYLKI